MNSDRVEEIRPYLDRGPLDSLKKTAKTRGQERHDGLSQKVQERETSELL